MNYFPDTIGSGDLSISQNTNSSANAGNSNVEENGLNIGDSSLQTPEEFNKDKGQKNEADQNQLTVSGIDDAQSNSDGAAGTDRAGTAERKNYGDPELNKGLESQAKDGESK